MRQDVDTRLEPTSAHAGSDWPAAVIAGAFQTGVLGVRSLVRRGVRAYCFDANPGNPGFRSVYGPARLCPNPDTQPEAWRDFMLRLAAEVGGRPVLIPSSDQFVSAIARHESALASAFRLSTGVRLQGMLADKRTQYALAAEHGMPMPRTAIATTTEGVRAFAAEAAFPCLLKPLHFREWQRFPHGHSLRDRKIAVAHSAEALIRQYELAQAINPAVVLQEVILGPDTAKRVYLSCYDSNGQRIASAMFRELRCDPLGFGPATVTEPVIDPEADHICDAFLRSIGYAGICEIEVKRDDRDGRVKLIEANPRLSGGGDAAPYAGVDLCWIHYLDLVGKPVRPVAARPRTFRHVVLRTDARAVVAYRCAGLISWKDILRSYRPPLAFFDFDPRDWRYSAETLYVTARLLAGGTLRALLGRGGPA